MKTLIISSSLSKTSRSFSLCQEVEKRLKNQGVDVTLFDARTIELNPTHKEVSDGMKKLSELVKDTDTIVFGFGIHQYSIPDSLKMILDTCCDDAIGKMYAMVCAAGGDRSYLSVMHLTHICINEFKMIQLPKTVYATKRQFDENIVANDEIQERLDDFTNDFISLGNKLL